MAATQEMEIDERYGVHNQYKGKETLSSSGAGVAFMIPGGDIKSIAYDLEGTGEVQVTNYDEADIVADVAEWRTVMTGELINPSISAIRQFNTSGTTVFVVRAQ